MPETAKRCHIGFDKNWINPHYRQAMSRVCLCIPFCLCSYSDAETYHTDLKNFYIVRTVFSDSQAPYYNVGHAGQFLPDALYNGQKAVFVTEGVFDAFLSSNVAETLLHSILRVIWHFWSISCRTSRRRQPFFWHSTTIKPDGRQARSYNRS